MTSGVSICAKLSRSRGVAGSCISLTSLFQPRLFHHTTHCLRKVPTLAYSAAGVRGWPQKVSSHMRAV